MTRAYNVIPSERSDEESSNTKNEIPHYVRNDKRVHNSSFDRLKQGNNYFVIFLIALTEKK